VIKLSHNRFPDFPQPPYRHRIRRLQLLRKQRYAQFLDLPAEILERRLDIVETWGEKSLKKALIMSVRADGYKHGQNTCRDIAVPGKRKLVKTRRPEAKTLYYWRYDRSLTNGSGHAGSPQFSQYL
jgi:hypothetical protein